MSGAIDATDRPAPERLVPERLGPDRLALVTGGTRGIGAAICLALRAQGRRVVASYRANEAEAARFAEKTGIPAMRFDAADDDACTQALSAMAEAHGAPTILVNNAGITRDASLGKMDRAMWDMVVDNNLGSAFNLCKLTFPAMRAASFGRIVNITSINGQTGQFGQVNYTAAKAGLEGMTRSLALEGARHGITANAVAPGYIDTDMLATVPDDILRGIVARIPAGRLGRPEEVARAVAFLTADEAGFITGTTLSVNGGQFM